MGFVHYAALLLCACIFVSGTMSDNQNGTGNLTRPAEVRIGALFTFDSVIGKAVRPAIELAVADVNADPSILPGTKLSVLMQDTNCSGFVGTIDGLNFFLIIFWHLLSQIYLSLQFNSVYWDAVNLSLALLVIMHE
jgi:glutamate receptor, ionotropic, plant